MTYKVYCLLLVGFLVLLTDSDAAAPQWDDKTRLKGELPEGFNSPTLYILKCSDPDGDTVSYKGTWATTVATDYFTFDDITGKIGVKAGAVLNLDTLPQTTFVLTAYCTDGTTDTTQSTIITLVTVASAPPEIPNPNLDFTVDEGVAGTTLIPEGGLSSSNYTTDATGDTLTFRIIPGSANVDYFTIDTNTGQISYAKDYFIDGTSPLPSTVSMVVEVKDQYDEINTVTVTFNIQDVNQIPEFKTLPTTVTVAEDLAPGSAVFSATATDRDSLDTVTLSALYGTGANIFGFDPATGTVSLKTGNNLDYETQKTFQVKVVADDTKDTKTSTLTVQVTNVNEAPSFDQPVYYVTENEGKAGATLTNTGFASSTSDPERDTMTYKIIGGANSNKFTMASSTGIFTYASDYEVDPTLPLPTNVVLDIEVSDPAGLTGKAKLDITIKNVNKPPTLDNLPATVSVPEDSTSGFLVFTPVFSDPDSVDSLSITSSHKTSGGASNFLIDSTTGKVTVKSSASLDFNVQSQYLVSFQVSDGTLTSATIDLTINILNVNKPPTFKFTTFSITVSEGKKGTTFPDPGIKTTAEDPDGDPITFSILPGTHSDKFQIDPNSGIVSYAQDYEVDPTALPNFVVLTLQAADPDGATVTTTLSVNIKDINKAPSVDNLPSTQTVAEDLASGSIIFTIQVSDPDSLDNPTVEYSFVDSSSSNLLDINRNTGVVTLRAGASLDFETRAVHQINVVASDGKINSTQTSLRIQVTNVNEAPVFDSTTYRVTGDEGSAGKTFPDAGIKAGSTDPDSDSLSYSIIGGDPNNRFRINPTSGQLSFNKDYEVDTLALPGFVTLTIQTADPSGLTDTATLDVTINNVNKPPVLDNLPKTVNVDENILGGTSIFTVASSDPDTGDSVTLQTTFNPNLGSTIFDINPNSGAVTLRSGAKLDYETRQTYSISFTATDGKATSITQKLTIDVNNVNEAPTFSASNYKSTVNEGPAGTVLSDAGIGASDVEGDSLSYSIISGANKDKFTINPSTGVVSFASEYEVDPTAQPGFAAITIQVSDPAGLTDTATVDVTINNINKPPTINNLPTSVNVDENILGGSPIFTATALDPDTVDTVTLQPTFSPNIGSTLFDVDLKTGAVILKSGAKLDYETRKTYSISFVATDGSATSVSQTLNINVDNVNEAPTFTRGSFTATVNEGPAGTTLPDAGLRTDSSDPEGDLLTYSILSGANRNKFAMNPTTGIVSFTSDYEVDARADPGFTSLTVQIADPAGLTDTATLDITINNVNKPPSINNLPKTVAIDENLLGGSPVFTVQATDPDSGDTVTFQPTFNPNSISSIFAVDNNSGSVSLNPTATLDYETTRSYSISFTATDGTASSPSQTLVITVNNVNEAPTFSGNSFTSTVNEGPAGTVLPLIPPITSAASDPEGDTLTYSIISGGNRDKFTMNPATGAISFAADYEVDLANVDQPSSVFLIVQVEDPSGLKKTATLDITIQNVNKAPIINNLPTTVSVPENTTGGSTIFIVNCTDPDTIDDITIVYNFLSGDGTLFDANPKTGLVSLKYTSKLDFESARLFVIRTDCTDSTLNSGFRDLSILVTDVNEAPSFTNPTYSVTVPEGPTGSIIVPFLTSSVTDPDTTDSMSFSLLTGTNSDKFNMDPTTGRITYAVPYETDPKALPNKVTLTVQVADQGGLTDTAIVSVNITNINKPPSITNLPQTITVKEDIPGGTLVFKVNTTDLDSADVITTYHSFLDTKSATVFDIDSTGRLTLKADAVLNYETDSFYRMRFESSDSVLNSSAAILEISIQDVNEAPSFTTSLSTSVNEGPAGTNIPDPGITSYSTDPERDAMTYGIVPGPNSQNFQMDPTSAALTFSQDYDADPTRKPGFVQLLVRATDTAGLSGTTFLNVTIQNVNQAPFITNLDATIKLSENTPAGTSIFTVSMSDPDTVDVTTLIPTYSVGAGNTAFDIDAKTGIVSVKTPSTLDYETIKQYSIDFTVTDSQLTSSIPLSLTINITNTNEIPKFNSPSYSATLPEGPAGSVVLTNLVNSVTDLDIGDVQTFSIVPGTYTEYFLIDPHSGNISFAKAYDVNPPTLPSNVKLTVQTTDLFSLVGTTIVDINILNINQPPTIINLPQIATVAADSDAGSEVFKVKANDPDSSDIITFTSQFLLTSDANQFSVNPSTGSVTVREGAQLVAESNSIRIVFTASDGSLTSNSSTLTIDVTAAAASSSFFSKSSNLAWFIPLMILLGLLLLGLLAFLLYKCCTNGGYRGKRRIFDSERQQKLVRSRPPTPELPPETKFQPKMNVKISDLQFPRIYKYVPN